MATEHAGPPRVRVDGDGATTVVPFDFPAMTAAEVKVYDLNNEDPDDPQLTDITGDVTVALTAGAEGGTVTFGVATEEDHVYIITRESEDVQGLVIPRSEAALNVRALERAYDRIYLVAQELKLLCRRALKFGVESAELDIDVEDPIAGHVLIWNDDGNKVVNSDRTWAGLLTALETAEANAISAANAAGQSAANAASSENNASLSAAAAATSEANAAGSEAAAALSAANAANSANAAATSEANAAASETAAELAETNAETAQAAAEAAQAAAEAAQAAAEAAAGTGGVFAAQNVVDGGNINHTNAARQFRPVQGNGGAPATVDNTPMGIDPTNFANSMEITLIGLSDAAYVRIVPDDVQYGVLDPNGAINITRGVKYQLTYSSDLQRFIGSRGNV